MGIIEVKINSPKELKKFKYDIDIYHMKTFRNFLNEAKNQETGNFEIQTEEDFREFAEMKFKKAFGKELDKKRMKFTIDGLLNDNKPKKDLKKMSEEELAEYWGDLIGKLNKSFG